jgi:hypothetical protein
MDGGFLAIAPYFENPLFLIGFFIFLAFLFARFLVKQGIIPPLPVGPGFRVLNTILLYGFLTGVLLVVFSFEFKYRELVGHERQEALDREQRRRAQEATEREVAQERAEREQQRLRAEAEKRQEQINTVQLLRQELGSNLKSVEEMRKNTETSLDAMLSVAKVLRHPGIKILPILFPQENLDPKFQATPSLAMKAMANLNESGLLKDDLEIKKFAATGRVLASTIDRTIGTVESLSDKDHKRYAISTQVWDQNLQVLRDITVVDVTEFQKCYAELASLRTHYDIIQSQTIDYLESVREFFRSQDGQVTKEGLAKVLAAEHLAVALSADYGKQLIADLASIRKLSKKISPATLEKKSSPAGS